LDLWPETLEAIGVVKSPRILSWVGRLVKYIYNRCDLVLGQSKAFYDGIAKYSDNKEKIRYFPSWSETVFVDNNSPAVNGLMKTNSFKVLFAGNVGEAQDFPAILSAAELINIQKQKIKFFVVGDGRAFEDLKIQIVNRGLQDVVILLGRYPLEDMPSFYSAADVLIVTLKESKAFSMTIPGKLQSYMAAGKPVLTMLSGEGSRVVKDADCGLVAMSGDYEAFSENIVAMSRFSIEELEKLGLNAKRYADEEFSRDKLISQLESWFEEVKKNEK
jgi:glycosyltransferase involved in cell wall biosynthesis